MHLKCTYNFLELHKDNCSQPAFSQFVHLNNVFELTKDCNYNWTENCFLKKSFHIKISTHVVQAWFVFSSAIFFDGIFWYWIESSGWKWGSDFGLLKKRGKILWRQRQHLISTKKVHTSLWSSSMAECCCCSRFVVLCDDEEDGATTVSLLTDDALDWWWKLLFSCSCSVSKRYLRNSEQS